MSDGNPLERRTAYVAGQVQGVGFRFTTQRIARNLAVAGFVQNLPDGQVLVVAEGEPRELDRFFSRLQEQMGHYIRQTHVTPGPATGEFTSFEIRF